MRKAGLRIYLSVFIVNAGNLLHAGLLGFISAAEGEEYKFTCLQFLRGI